MAGFAARHRQASADISKTFKRLNQFQSFQHFKPPFSCRQTSVIRLSYIRGLIDTALPIGRNINEHR
ncbi:MAG: hypothetical protein K0M55_12710 [Rhizobium sp.]|nr:hypothetical protein [Rhizobium sp.]MBW8322327.1 hypothetical protein [Rhizobium sp.]MBW8447662.1 hypothetical protein [Arenimonas sp.]